MAVHHPIIVNPNVTMMHLAYGIAEDRRLKLVDEMTRRFNTGPARLGPVWGMIDEIADFCENDNEFVFCLTVQLTYAERKGKNLF